MATYLVCTRSSATARELSQATGFKRIKGTAPHRNRGHVYINWGNSELPQWMMGRTIINHPLLVARAINKLECLQRLNERGVTTPDFTTRRETAEEWVRSNKVVVARAQLRGHSGQGIEIVTPGNQVPNAPLYTKHVRHKDEYRIHVVNHETIYVTQKKKKQGENADPFVRSHKKGWVFVKIKRDVPEDVLNQAHAAVDALGLVFGAVDIAYRVKEQKAYVLEVNTAPGLEGTTLTKWIEALRHV